MTQQPKKANTSEDVDADFEGQRFADVEKHGKHERHERHEKHVGPSDDVGATDDAPDFEGHRHEGPEKHERVI